MTKRTNYNNFNYNNNNNDVIITYNDNITVCETDTNAKTTSIPLTKDKEVKRETAERRNVMVCAEQGLPDNWKFCKADLFDHGSMTSNKYKISLSICRKGKIQQVRAQLNSPFRHMKRGLGEGLWHNDTHYQAVQDAYKELSDLQANPRASKVYLANKKYGKGDHVVGFSVILARHNDQFYLFVFYLDHVFKIKLKGAGYLSAKQKQKNIVATGMLQADTQRNGISAKDIWDD